jgi:hypothetical protein
LSRNKTNPVLNVDKGGIHSGGATAKLVNCRRMPKSLSENSVLGSTGYQPVPSGDSPDGRASASAANLDARFPAATSPVPVGGSPTGAGEPPAPPIFRIGSNGQPGVSTASDPVRFAAALRRFDEENARDPNTELVEGTPRPRELLYAQRLTDWVLALNPDAPEELRLAARSQHLCRWMIPRGSYEMTRAGYLRWRNELKSFHAAKAGEILREVGYPEEMVVRVQHLNLKKNFPGDLLSRTLEDALCLVFLEFQFADLVSKTAEDKIVNAVQKTWKKMTASARERALRLEFGPRERALIERALTRSDGGAAVVPG